MTRRFSDALFTRLAHDGAHAEVVVPRAEAGPFDVYVPQGYEPSYAYPLVVWFHESGQSERAMLSVMSKVTDRNALGLSIRGERVRRTGGFDWLGGTRPRRVERLLAAMRELRSEFHIHTERIVLAGEGSGAGAAAQLFGEHLEWFGGLALFGTPWRTMPKSWLSPELSEGKPVLIDVAEADRLSGRVVANQMQAIGMDVTYQESRLRGLPMDTCRSLDRWLLSRVCGAAIIG